jgi:hypothetical protein
MGALELSVAEAHRYTRYRKLWISCKYGSCWHTSQRGLPYLASSSVAEEFHKSSLYPGGPRQGGRGGVEQLSDAVVGSLGIHSFPLKKRRLSRSSQSAREIRYALSSFAMSEGS